MYVCMYLLTSNKHVDVTQIICVNDQLNLPRLIFTTAKYDKLAMENILEVIDRVFWFDGRTVEWLPP